MKKIPNKKKKKKIKKTSIKPAIPKHTCSLCDYQTNKKPLLKAHEKKPIQIPMTGNVLNATIKHIGNIILYMKIFAIIVICVLIPQLVPTT